MIISLIAAVGKNRAIGLNGDLPWKLRDDFKHFKKTTSGHFLIMGRKTFETLPSPLPNRTTLIVTNQKNYKAPQSCHVFHSVEKALDFCQEQKQEEVFVAGGGVIYKECLLLAHRFYLSLVDYEGEADTFFPPYDDVFKKIVTREKHPQDQHNDHEWELIVLEK